VDKHLTDEQKAEIMAAWEDENPAAVIVWSFLTFMLFLATLVVILWSWGA
jgi:hypothetical protein